MDKKDLFVGVIGDIDLGILLGSEFSSIFISNL
jgi:hypothetical protein